MHPSISTKVSRECLARTRTQDNRTNLRNRSSLQEAGQDRRKAPANSKRQRRGVIPAQPNGLGQRRELNRTEG